MLSAACWCLVMAAGPMADSEYAGTAYAERGSPPTSIAVWCRGQALVWAVRAGVEPADIERVFGPPAVVGQFRCGPVEWWYPELGVTAYFAPRQVRPVGPAVRVRGGVE